MANLYDRLKAFLSSGIRMSHVYQPVMLRRLLVGGGRATRREIAEEILLRDPTQIEYYETIVRDMVGRVLTAKGDLVRKDGASYRLPEADTLSSDELAELIADCDGLIDGYEARRGAALWEHRRRSRRPVPGTLRYEVLKRAAFRCELCGVSAAEKALEVDHIVPRNLGGTNDLLNLQALCYTCNASKKDRDDTDFRGVAASYECREPGCIFCDVDPRTIVQENRLALVRRDGFPVTELHSLIIPKRHVADYFDLTQPELNAVAQLLRDQRRSIIQSDIRVGGFNVGVNAGQVAGQTVMHAHIHLIPRRAGDVPEPRGGIRHLIPGKGSY